MSRFVTTGVGSLAEKSCLGTLAENYLGYWVTTTSAIPGTKVTGHKSRVGGGR